MGLSEEDRGPEWLRNGGNVTGHTDVDNFTGYVIEMRCRSTSEASRLSPRLRRPNVSTTTCQQAVFLLSALARVVSAARVAVGLPARRASQVDEAARRVALVSPVPWASAAVAAMGTTRTASTTTRNPRGLPRAWTPVLDAPAFQRPIDPGPAIGLDR